MLPLFLSILPLQRVVPCSNTQVYGDAALCNAEALTRHVIGMLMHDSLTREARAEGTQAVARRTASGALSVCLSSCASTAASLAVC
jgi:hypothetical protein